MLPKTPAFNNPIQIEKKIESAEYALSINNIVKAAEKYNVSETIIRYWKTQLNKS